LGRTLLAFLFFSLLLLASKVVEATPVSATNSYEDPHENPKRDPCSEPFNCIARIIDVGGPQFNSTGAAQESFTVLIQIVPVVVGTILGFALTLLKEVWERSKETRRLLANLRGEVTALKTRLHSDLESAIELRTASRVEPRQVLAEPYATPYPEDALSIAVGRLDLLPRQIQPLVLQLRSCISSLKRFPSNIALNPNAPVLNTIGDQFEKAIKSTLQVLTELGQELGAS